MVFSPAVSDDLGMSCPDSLEKIFQQLEEESERRAQDDSSAERRKSVRKRRRASVSISRFGQVSEDASSSDPAVHSPPVTPNRLSVIAAQSSLYQSPMNNHSTGSIASVGCLPEVEEAHEEDEHHVTQVHQIAPRQSTISRAVGDLLSRRTRSRSGSVLSNKDGVSPNMIIGVSVVENSMTVAPHEDETDPVRVIVSSSSDSKLRNRRSRLSLLAGGVGLLDKARELSNKLRTQSRTDLKVTRSNASSATTTSIA